MEGRGAPPPPQACQHEVAGGDGSASSSPHAPPARSGRLPSAKGAVRAAEALAAAEAAVQEAVEAAAAAAPAGDGGRSPVGTENREKGKVLFCLGEPVVLAQPWDPRSSPAPSLLPLPGRPPAGVPFGGYKSSGIGRDKGEVSFCASRSASAVRAWLRRRLDGNPHQPPGSPPP